MNSGVRKGEEAPRGQPRSPRGQDGLSAHRRPGYPSVGLRPRRARLRFTRRQDHKTKGQAGARPKAEDQAHLRCEGKGRKQRCTPLRQEAVEVMAQWLRECPGEPATPAFPSSRGGPMSRDAVERLVSRHQRTAERHCPSIGRKKVTPHVLRHTAAMQLLQHGIDRSVIALWLGHESVETTQMYLHADLRLKEEALFRMTPLDVQPGRFRPDDERLAFLEGL